MENVELRATQTLLEKGVSVPVAAPLFLRLFGKKTIRLKIYQPCLGNKIRISELFLNMKCSELLGKESITQEQADTLLIKHGRTIAKITAIGMLRGYWSPKLFAWLLARYLLWKAKPIELLIYTQLLIVGSGTQDFMNTIMCIQAIKITTPHLSQATPRS